MIFLIFFPSFSGILRMERSVYTVIIITTTLQSASLVLLLTQWVLGAAKTVLHLRVICWTSLHLKVRQLLWVKQCAHTEALIYRALICSVTVMNSQRQSRRSLRLISLAMRAFSLSFTVLQAGIMTSEVISFRATGRPLWV